LSSTTHQKEKGAYSTSQKQSHSVPEIRRLPKFLSPALEKLL